MSAPTWWFVITRPVDETIEPEPPVEMRTQDFWTCSSHFASTSKPYFSFNCFVGGRLKSHMPSSACAQAAVATREATSRMALRTWMACIGRLRFPWEIRRRAYRGRPATGRRAAVFACGVRGNARDSVALEVLHGALVLLRRSERLERPEVAPLAGLRVLLARVQPVPALRELADHRSARLRPGPHRLDHPRGIRPAAAEESCEESTAAGGDEL